MTVDANQSPNAVAASPGIRRLLASTATSIAGQGAVATAIPLLAARLTRDPFSISLAMAATPMAWLVVGLVAGALVDRWPRRLTMVVADLVRASILAGLVLALATDRVSLALLIACVFGIAIAGCFFDPASQAAIPVLVGRDERRLAKANGRLWTLDVLGRSLIGPPVGAALFAFATPLPFVLNVVTFLASAALLSGLRGIGRPSSGTTGSGLGRSVIEGLRYLAGHRQLRLLTLGMTAYNFGFNVAFSTLVLFAQDRLGVSERGFGVLLAVAAVGGVIGGWLAPRVQARATPRQTYAACLTFQGIAWTALLLFSSVWASAGCLLAIGTLSTVVTVVGGTARHKLTPDHLLGRISAGTRVAGIGAAAIGAVVGGAVGSLGGLGAPLVVAAGVLLGSAAMFALAADANAG